MSNEMKPIALGADHAGFSLKEELRRHLEEQGIPYRDFGSYDGERCDYPDKAVPPCEAVVRGDCSFAVLCCGTGIGMALAADKVAGVRASSITRPDFAQLFRQHNNGNVICLSGRFITLEENEEIVKVFLTTEFEGGRHAQRVAKIAELDETGRPGAVA